MEIVFFMRNVRSRNFFEQMKGRGVRIIPPTEFQAVTPDATNKDRFVIVDAVGVTEGDLSDSYSLEKQPTVAFERLLELVGLGSRDPEVLSSLASRLARLDRHLTPQDRQAIADVAGGATLHTIISDLVRATDPDAPLDAARESTGLHDPPQEVVDAALQVLLEDAAKPLAANPELRQRLIDFRRSYMQTIDTLSADVVLEAGFTDAQDGTLVESIQQFIEDNRDEITALQALYERPYQQRLRYDDIKALADALQLPPRSWTTDQSWAAYRRLYDSRVQGSGQRVLTDIVALVRFAIGDAKQLAPFADHVHQRFAGWLAMQETAGNAFTPEQLTWLEAIRDHVAGSVSIEVADFQYAPFVQQGGIYKAYELFGDQLPGMLEELNLDLVR